MGRVKTSGAAAKPAVAEESVTEVLERMVASADSVRFEAELTRNPYSVKTWLGYLRATEESEGQTWRERRLLFERAPYLARLDELTPLTTGAAAKRAFLSEVDRKLPR